MQTRTHELIHVLEGTLLLTLGGAEHRLGAGATANIPAGTRQATTVGGHAARWISATSGGDAAKLFELAGFGTEEFNYPFEGGTTTGKLQDAAEACGVVLG